MATSIDNIKAAYKLFAENRKTTEQVDIQTEVKVEYPTSILLEKDMITEN